MTEYLLLVAYGAGCWACGYGLRYFQGRFSERDRWSC